MHLCTVNIIFFFYQIKLWKKNINNILGPWVTRVQSNRQVYNCRDEKLEGTKCSGEKLNKVGTSLKAFTSHMYCILIFVFCGGSHSLPTQVFREFSALPYLFVFQFYRIRIGDFTKDSDRFIGSQLKFM